MRERIPFIDSHTGGEPTRLILAGGPDLGDGDLRERCEVFRSRHGGFRSGVVEEPRGSEVLVGALLCPPSRSDVVAGVIFFNNLGVLGMCGHGMIGVVTSLFYLGRLQPGRHRFETPVGVVEVTLSASGDVSLANVPSYRFLGDVRLEVPEVGVISGEIAWGGNWFFLAPVPPPLKLELGQVAELVRVTQRIREALEARDIRGADGAEIDHVELYAPTDTADIRVFVLCPGGAWDRSPCGTGTSAKMACLAAEGRLAPGHLWRQESIVGSLFEGSYDAGSNGHILPTIRGRAHVMSEGVLLLEDLDPFRWGLAS